MKPDTTGRTLHPTFTISIVNLLAITAFVFIHFITFSFMMANKSVKFRIILSMKRFLIIWQTIEIKKTDIFQIMITLNVMYIQGSFNCWSFVDKTRFADIIFLWKVERFYCRHTIRCFGCKFLSSADVDVSGFDQPVDHSTGCASDTIHQPLTMVGLIIVRLQCNISIEMSKQCKYKLRTKLWGATIAPHNHFTQCVHQFFQLVNDGDDAAECSDSRVIIWFPDNRCRKFSQIVLAIVAVIRARCIYANILLTKIGRLYLMLLRVAIAFTIVNLNKCLSGLQIQLLLLVGCHLLSILVDMLFNW